MRRSVAPPSEAPPASLVPSKSGQVSRPSSLVSSPPQQASALAVRHVPTAEAMLLKHGPPGLHGVSSYDIKMAFDSMDADDNGFLSASELLHFLTISFESATEDEVDEMIRIVDADGDGQVSFEEFYQLLAGTPLRDPTSGEVRISRHSKDKKDRTAGDILYETKRYRKFGLNANDERYQFDEEFEAGGGGIVGGLEELQKELQAEEEEEETRRAPLQKQKTLLEIAPGLEITSAQLLEEGISGKYSDVTMEFLTSIGVGSGGLKPSYVKKLFQKFQRVDQDGSGQIDYSEFCQVLEQEDSPMLKRMFEMFDKDKSGILDVREFLTGISLFTKANQAEKIKFAFMMFDEDASGFLDKRELCKILKSNFLTSDISDSKLQDRAEMLLKLAGPSAVQNQKMAFEEFAMVSQSQPGLLFPAQQALDMINRGLKIT